MPSIGPNKENFTTDSSSNQGVVHAGGAVSKHNSHRLSSDITSGLSGLDFPVSSQGASSEVSNQQRSFQADVSLMISDKFNQFERRLQEDGETFLDYQDISNRFNKLKQKVPFFSSDARSLNLLWNRCYGSSDVLFSNEELSQIPKNPIWDGFQKMVSKLSDKILSPEDLKKPIG